MASRDGGESSRGAVVVSEPVGELPFRTMVGRVTEVLAVSLDLPSLEAWREAYLAAPGRYDAELLGFWREARES